MRFPERGCDRGRFAAVRLRLLQVGTKLEAWECAEWGTAAYGLFQIVRRTPQNSETKCIDRPYHARDRTQTIHRDSQAGASPASSVRGRSRSGIETSHSALLQWKSGNAVLRRRDLSALRCIPRRRSTSHPRLREIAGSEIHYPGRDGPAKTYCRPQF